MRLVPLLHLAEEGPPSLLAGCWQSSQALMALLLVLGHLPAVLALRPALMAAMLAMLVADACQLAGWMVAWHARLRVLFYVGVSAVWAVPAQLQLLQRPVQLWVPSRLPAVLALRPALLAATLAALLADDRLLAWRTAACQSRPRLLHEFVGRAWAVPAQHDPLQRLVQLVASGRPPAVLAPCPASLAVLPAVLLADACHAAGWTAAWHSWLRMLCASFCPAWALPAQTTPLQQPAPLCA